MRRLRPGLARGQRLESLRGALRARGGAAGRHAGAAGRPAAGAAPWRALRARPDPRSGRLASPGREPSPAEPRGGVRGAGPAPGALRSDGGWGKAAWPRCSARGAGRPLGGADPWARGGWWRAEERPCLRAQRAPAAGSAGGGGGPAEQRPLPRRLGWGQRPEKLPRVGVAGPCDVPRAGSGSAPLFFPEPEALGGFLSSHSTLARWCQPAVRSAAGG